MMDLSAINSPVFIVGSARSGKSLLGNLLAIHEDTCWFSNYSEKFPKYPEVSFFHRMKNLPILGRIIKKSIISYRHQRFWPRPTEGEVIYHDYCKITRHRIVDNNCMLNFHNQEAENRFVKSVYGHVKYNGKNRFINDQSDNTQRIKLIKKIFPSSYIIHVIRDGRAVAHEVMLSKWWTDVWIWWYGKTPRQWIEEGGSSLILSGCHWVKNIDAVIEDKVIVSDRYLEIRYEELTLNPRETIEKVLWFCKLQKSKDYINYIPRRIENYNFRWKSELSSNDILSLEKEIGFRLNSLGYK